MLPPGYSSASAHLKLGSVLLESENERVRTSPMDLDFEKQDDAYCPSQEYKDTLVVCMEALLSPLKSNQLQYCIDMVGSAPVFMGIVSATSMVEQLGKAFNDLVSHKEASEDIIQWKDIEEHFHNLGRLLKNRFDELEEKEKAFVEKESETHALLAEREAVVAAKEQASLDRIQGMKDAAVASVEVRAKYKPTSLEPVNVGGSTESKDIFLGCSASCFVREGNDGSDSKDELFSQKQSYTDRTPKLITNEVPKGGISVNSGTPVFCSQIAYHSRYKDLSEDCNTHGTQANDNIRPNQMTSCEVKGGLDGLRKVDDNVHNLHISPYDDGINDHADRVPGLNATEVPLCSQNASGCEYEDLCGDCSRKGTQANSSIWSNEMISCEVKDDVIGLRNVDVHVHNPQHSTLSTSPIRVKVEYSDNDLRRECRDGTNVHVDRFHRQNSAVAPITEDSCTVAPCSQNSSTCQYEDFPVDCSRKGTEANENISSNQMTSGEVKGDFVGLRKVDVHIHNLPQIPALSTFPVKVKVEYSDNDFINPHGDCVNGHVARVLELNAAEVPKSGIAVDSGTGALCSQNASGCQYEGLSIDCIKQGIQCQANDCISSNRMTAHEVKGDAIGLTNVDGNAYNLPQNPALSAFPIKVKVEGSDNDLMSPCGDGINRSSGVDVQAVKVNGEIHVEFGTDDLDHILLKERRRMLQSRRSLGTVAGADRFGLLEGVSLGESSYLTEDINQHNYGTVEGGSHCVDVLSSMAESYSQSILETKASEVFSTSPKAIKCWRSISPRPTNFHGSSSSDSKCSSQTTSIEFKALGGEQELMPVNHNKVLGSAFSTLLGTVKFESVENGLESPCKNDLETVSNDNMIVVKDYLELPNESFDDELDHIPLQERIKLLISKKVLNVDSSRNLKCLRKTLPSVLDCYPTVSNTKPRCVNNRRKRKKTATDSVETALEEDAPGLLQVLVEKGITIDEIKLYENMEDVDHLDDSSNEDSFAELEAVISKLFSQPSSLLKFAPLRCSKGSKASYCLACLISLVEQTRYLQFRKWPVEWGWCRDLQSFIFVFERHNRIVLERPEYGYATYFFELVDSLPIDWQIKRLVTAMKLASCSRITIIEDKPLLVGEDLTEGEARVLEEYGWTPNTGLGTMLNYCERVVHDRKNENGSEWRSKIGKLLMNGYNGGTIVLANLPRKVTQYRGPRSPQISEYKGTQNPQIKLEL